MAADRNRASGNRTVSKTTKAKSASSGRFVSKKATSARDSPRASGATAPAKKSATSTSRQQEWAYASPSTDKSRSWLPQQRAKFVVEAVGGTRRTADLLEVSPSQPSRWVSGESVPGPGQARMLVDLEYVLTHALLVWADISVARDWLSTPNAHLDGARPVDWLRVNGTAEVVDALRAEAAGAYA